MRVLNALRFVMSLSAYVYYNYAYPMTFAPYAKVTPLTPSASPCTFRYSLPSDPNEPLAAAPFVPNCVSQACARLSSTRTGQLACECASWHMACALATQETSSPAFEARCALLSDPQASSCNATQATSQHAWGSVAAPWVLNSCFPSTAFASFITARANA